MKKDKDGIVIIDMAVLDDSEFLFVLNRNQDQYPTILNGHTEEKKRKELGIWETTEYLAMMK